MLERAEIKARSKAACAANRGIGIGAYAVYALIIAAISGATFGAAALIIVPVLTVGYAFFATRFYLGDLNLNIGDIFSKSFDNFGRKLGGMLWMMLWVYLWTLLFIIPGIIKGLAYSMTPYILANDPNVEATEALKLSMRMTDGHKGEIFVMILSFIGWELLSAFTFGILELVYVGPYREAALAGLYVELRDNAVANGIVSEAEFNGEHF
ncbi:MAG: DUF975 family protein [Clostridiaceae bacterium]|nr:DUF975 family protein [Clostridiaceae bacterium]